VGARPKRHANHLGAPALAPFMGDLIELAIRAIVAEVEKRGNDIGSGMRRFQQIDARGRRAGGGEDSAAPELEIFARAGRVAVGIGVTGQRGRQAGSAAGGGSRIPNAVRRLRAGLRQLFARVRSSAYSGA